MNKKAKILIFCMIFVASGAFSQISPGKTAFSGGKYGLKPVVKDNKRLSYNTYFHEKGNKPTIPVKLVPFLIISADHYTRNFGFFCKKELQFEKITRIPFKFRLGSVQYCDWMEGKRTAGILPD